MTEALARAGTRHNCNVELLYRRRTRRACSLFQRLALPQRLLLHCAKAATAPTILKSSVCQNDPFGVLPPGSTGVYSTRDPPLACFPRLPSHDERPPPCAPEQ